MSNSIYVQKAHRSQIFGTSSGTRSNQMTFLQPNQPCQTINKYLQRKKSQHGISTITNPRFKINTQAQKDGAARAKLRIIKRILNKRALYIYIYKNPHSFYT